MYQLDTQTFHRCQVRYEARRNGAKNDPPLPKTAPAQPRGPLDWFLTSLEHYRADRFEPAAEACEMVLREQPSHFWARYLQALCQLRASQWVEARAALTGDPAVVVELPFVLRYSVCVAELSAKVP